MRSPTRDGACSTAPAARIVCTFLVLVVCLLSASSSALAQEPGPDVYMRTLVRGARIGGTNGIAFDSQNRLYVASVFHPGIVIMNPWTGRIIDTLGPEEGVQGPDDVVVGPDGSLYWTDFFVGEVGRRAPDGTVTKQPVAPFVNPIAFSPDGRLFVAQAFMADGLFELDPQLEADPTQLLGTGDPAAGLNGMAFGPDGLLYAPRQDGATVRIDVDTGEVEVLSDEVSGACAFDDEGVLHVAAEGRVVQLDPDTGDVSTVATTPDSVDNLAFSRYGYLYVSNFRDGTIHRITRSGRLRPVKRGGLIAPAGVAVLPKPGGGESIFVTDFFSLREFDGWSGRPGMDARSFFFDCPFSAAPDGEHLILTSWFGNVVSVWDPATQAPLEVHEFAAPLNAVRFMGDLVVAELGTGNVVRQDAAGKRTPLAEGLAVPTGLAYTEDDLWVAEWATGNVYQIVADGVVQPEPVLAASGLAFPEGMALDRDGTLLVVESGAGRLSRIEPDTGTVTTVVDGLSLGEPAAPNWPPTWHFNGVAVGRWGAIYVTGDVDNVVYRIRVRS